jgi:hypothetical protein
MALALAQDYHPELDMRAQAAEANDTAAAALSCLHGDENLRQGLQACFKWLCAVLRAENSRAQHAQHAAAAGLEPQPSPVDQDLGWAPWLRVCSSLIAAWDR